MTLTAPYGRKAVFSLLCLKFKAFNLSVGTRKSNHCPVNEGDMSTILENVVGYSGRQNTLMLSLEGDVQNVIQNVIFFPGDIQNYHDKMSENFQSHQWKNWSYEGTIKIIRKRFPGSMVWLVQPRRLHDEVFSCYDNFLQSDILGSPKNLPEYFDAIVHLEMLLQKGSHMFMSMLAAHGKKDDTNEKDHNLETDIALNDIPVTLVGFSKGCVVLNQIIYELGKSNLPETPNEHYYSNFLKKLKSIFWLDGGHSAPDVNVWITERDILSKLVTVDVHVHVTPWQIQDLARPYIGDQERLFVDTLKSCGGRVTEKLHFPGERKFENHFNILHEF